MALATTPTKFAVAGPGNRIADIRSPMIPPLFLPLRSAISALSDNAKATFSPAVRSVYRATAHGQPDQIASCLLLEIGGEKLLLTAAHVCDHNDESSLYIVGANELVLLETDFIITAKPKGDRNRDRGDFAATRLPADLVAKLGPGFISEDQIGSPAAKSQGHVFTALGYPNQTNAGLDDKTHRVLIALQSHTATRQDSRRMRAKAGNGGQAHIFIEYGKHSRVDGRKATSVRANGFSGGALIDAGPPTALVRGHLTSPPTLVGMIIERWHQDRVLVAVRLDIILPLIKDALGM